MDKNQYQEIKSKIRHFLLKNSSSYRRAVTQGVEPPPVSLIARQLHKLCPIGERRLQKYLYDNTSQKDLSINLFDLIEFSRLAKCSLGSFISYLFEEESTAHNMSEKQLNMLGFYSQLDLGDRRELSLRVFNPKAFAEGENIIRMALNISRMGEEEKTVLKRLIDVLSNASTHHR